MVLEAVYEVDFRGCSYGFRPGRNAHQALTALGRGLIEMGGGTVIEVDIKGFFDNLGHGHLRSFLDSRVRDGALRRMIDKWLKAGVLEEGNIKRSVQGTPQGGVISPLLANVYLHHVLDAWFEDEIKPRLSGRSFLIRYADDFVIVLENEDEAARMMTALAKRFAKYGLELHPEKTRVVRFIRPRRDRKGEGQERPGTFDLLGFTLYWGKARKGNWAVKWKTSKKAMKRTLTRLNRWLRRKRHQRVRDQHAALCKSLEGHYAYFGVTGNARALNTLRTRVERFWRYWLNRRSQKPKMPWDRFKRLLKVYPLPMPRFFCPGALARSETMA
jgi:group II intron reverse transcriptase/maturase